MYVHTVREFGKPLSFNVFGVPNLFDSGLRHYVGVAQLDRAFGYGPKGREFESSRPRLKIKHFEKSEMSLTEKMKTE